MISNRNMKRARGSERKKARARAVQPIAEPSTSPDVGPWVCVMIKRSPPIGIPLSVETGVTVSAEGAVA